MAETETNGRCFTVRDSKQNMVMGVLFFFGSIGLFFWNLSVNFMIEDGFLLAFWMFLSCVMLFIAGLFSVYSYFRRLVTVDGDLLTYRPLFGKTVTLPFSDIGRVADRPVQGGHTDITVYSKEKKKLFRVDSTCIGFESLVSRLKNRNVPFQRVTGSGWFPGKGR